MTYQTPHPGRPPAPGSVDPRELRPRRLWYVIGPAIFVLCCLLAVGIFVWTLYGAFSGFQRFDSGKATLQMSPGDDRTLYASTHGGRALASRLCTVSGTGQARFDPVLGTKKLVRNGTAWYAVADIHVLRPGEYDVSCPRAGDIRFAIGATFSVGGLLSGIFAIIGIPFTGFLIGGAIVLITALRRSGHKKRLLAAAAGPAHPGAPGPWPGGPPPPPPGYPPPPELGPRSPYGPG